MHFHVLVLIFFAALFGSFPAQVEPAGPEITRPAEGAALQGVVEIRGTSEIEGFLSAETAFAYEGEETWFLIEQSSQPVTNGRLARWDTTTIADGTYNLRLVVHRRGGEPLEVLVRGLRVRNYSPVETSAPVRQSTAAPAAQPSATLAPLALLSTPTALPLNPVQVTGLELSASLTQGVVITLFVFLVIGIYAGVRRLSRGG